MTQARHKNQLPSQGIHGIISFVYPTSSSRLAATFDPTYDLYKVAIDQDTGLTWMITSINGSGVATWQPAAGSGGAGLVNVSAGTTSNNLTNFVLSNSNGVSFGLSGSTVTASFAGGGNINVSAGTTSNFLTNIVFSNSNSVSFGLSGSTLTGSIPNQTSLVHSNSNNVSFGIAGSTLTASASFPAQTAYVFSNSNGVSFGTNGSTVTASVPAQSAQTQSNIQAVYDGANSISTGTIRYSNANGVSFGINGQTLTGSVAAQTSLSYSNANGVSFGIAGSTLTASVSVPTGSVNVSAGTTSNNLTNFVFSNSNGLTFGLNGSTITGSYTVPTQTAYVFSNSNGVSFGTNGSTVTASVIPPAASINVSAGTTSNNLTNFVFSNSNGVSFGLNASTITASYTVPTQSNQTEGRYAIGNTVGQSSSSTFDARTMSISGVGNVSVGYSGNALIVSGSQSAFQLSNSNGISFGTNGSTVTASYTVPSTAGLISNVNISAGTTSNNLTNFVFSNSNGLSFGLNGSTITGSYTVPTQTVQTQNLVVVGAGTQTATSGTLSFVNSNGISFGMSNSNAITASYTVPSTAGLISQINVSAGTTSNNLTNFVFSNSNNVSFGLNGSTITATVPTQTAQTVGLYAVSNTTGASSSSTVDARSISFQGAGNISVGYTNGSVVISGSGNGNGNVNISAGTTSNNLTNFVFSNSNGLSFGLNGSTVTGSYTQAAQTAQTVGLYALGNTTQNSSTTLDARSLSFNGLGIITAGYSNGSIQISATQSNQTANIVVPTAGTQTATSGTVAFANSNGISFGMSGSSQITASYTVPSTAGLISQINVSAGTTSNNLSALTFSNSNGISFGLNASTITASYTVPTQTAQTVGLYGLGNTTQNSSTTLDARSLSFNGLGLVTVGYSNGSIQISGTQSNQTEGMYAIGNTAGQSSSSTFDARTMSISGVGNISVGYSGNALLISGSQSAFQLSNSNGISFGTNGSTVTASYTVPSTAGLISQINVSAGTTSNNLSALTFSNSNGISFGLNASTITASYTVPTQTAQTVGLYGLGNTTQNSSTTLDARSLSFNGLGIITVGYSNGSIQISGTQSNQTANIVVPTAGTQTATSGTVAFANSNGISFGMSGSSQITASYTVPSTVGLISQINVSAGTTSNNLSALTFSNSNGISFGLNASTITASYTVPTQTAQTVGLYGLGNTTQNSSTTLDARSLSFNGLGAATVGYSNGSIQLSVPVQSAQTQSNIQAIYDGANSISTGTIRYSNSNGVSFGINGQTLTASVLAQSNQSVGLYALGNTTQNSSTTLDARSLSFNGLGIVTAGYSNGSIQISATQSNQTEGRYAIGNTIGQSSSSTFDARTMSISAAGIASVGYSGNALIISVPSAGASVNISAGTTSGNLGAVTFSNSNGVSFGLNNGVITATVTPGAAAGIAAVLAGTQTQTSGTLSFSNSNGISFGLSNSSVLTASYTVPSTAGLISAVNVSAGTTSSNISNFVFSNSNGLSFGLNGSTITGSYSQAAQTNQTEGRYAIGNTTGQSSSSTFDARTMSISGAGNISVGYSGNALVISGSAAAGSVNISAGTTSNNLTNFVFSNSNNVSFGLNGSTVTATVTTPAQTAQTVGLYAIGNTTQNSSTTLDARTLSFNGLGIITAGYSNGSIQISATQSAQTQSVVVPSAGTQSATSGTVIFSNSNGISFGMSNSSVITASYTVPTQTAQTIGLYGLGNTTQNSSTTLDARSLSFNGLGAITVGYSNGSIQLSAPVQTAYQFSNSNGISFGTNGSTVTASYTVPTQTAQTVGLYALGNTTQNSSTTLDARSLSFNGLGIVTAGYSNGSIQISATQSAQTQNVVVPSAGTQSATSGTVIFSNSNGISFGMSNSSVITASYTVPTQTVQSINFSAGTTSNNATNIVFSNSNGLSFGLNGSTITGSYTQAVQTVQTVGFYAVSNTTGASSSSTFDARSISFQGAGVASVGYTNGSVVISVPTGVANVNISAGTTSNNLTNFVFSNSNNVSFGLNGSTVTATVTTPAQTAQTIGLYALGNTTQNSSTTLDARTLSFNGLGIITAGYSNGSIQISATQSAQTQNVVVAQAGTQTATSGTVVFSNSNGISFGMSNSSVITASYTVPSTAGLISQINVSAGTTSNNLSALTFSNSNGISFGLNASTITASYTVPIQTAQTVGLYALGNTTQNSSTTLDARSLSFNGLGIITAGYSNGSIQISATQSNQTANIVVPTAGTQTATSGTVAFANSNGISFGMSGSSQITASYTVPSTAGLISQINVSAGTTSNNLSALTFSNSNGISFGLNASTITASYTVPTQTAQTVGLYALGNTTQNSSTTLDARSLSFNGLGIVTAGYSNGSIQISATQSAQTQNVVVPSAGTQSATSGTVIFSNSNGISFGMSNSSVITASYTVPTQTAQTVGLYALGNTTQNSSTTLDARSLSFNGLGAATVGYSNGSIQISVPNALTNINISAGTTSNNLTAFTFSNSNGISFGLNASTITASYTVPTQSNQTEGRYAIGNTTGQSSSSTFDARTMSISGAGNISVGYSGNALVVSGSQSNQTANVIVAQAGTQTATSGTVVFSNSNGISFGMSNSSVITASYTVPTQTIQSINFSAGTTSNNATNIVFSNSNGLAFGLNGSTITGSYTQAAQTVQTVGLYALGNTTQNSSTTLDARSLSFNGLGIVTAGYSNGSIQISATQSVQTQNVVVAQAGTQTATSGTVVFSNSNGISFGMSNSSVVTASYTVPSTAGLISQINVSAGTTSNNLTALTFSNSNGISFGLNASTITASYTVPTQTAQTVGLYAVSNTTGASSSTTVDARSLSFQGAGVASVGYTNGSVVISVPTGIANVNISAGTTSNNLTNFVFSNSNNVSFGLNGSTVTATVTTPAQTAQTIGLYAIGNTTQNSSTTLDARTLSFNGLGIITAGYSNGSIQISATQSNQTANVVVPSAGTQTATSGTVVFSNSNGISFGMSNSSVVTASYTVPSTAGLISQINVSAGTTSNNLTALTFSNSNGISFGLNASTITASYTVPTQTAQTIGLYAVSNTTGASSSTTIDARSLSFQGAGVASVGYTNGSVVISVPTGVANVNISAGTTSNNLTNFVFSNSNNVSFGLNGSTVTATVTTPAQTAQTIGLYAIGNTTQNSSTTLDARTLSFNGLGIITAGYSNGSIQISATQSNQTANVVVPSAGTQTATSGTVVFSNSNGISFGMSNSSVVTASYTVPSTAGLISQINVSAGTTSNNLSALTFSNSNGISFGLNASTITASYTVPTQTAQTVGLYALGNTTQNSSTTLDARSLSFNGLGIITAGYSNGSIQISATQSVQTQSNVQGISAGTQLGQTGNIVFSNSNGITFGMSNSSVITASYTVPSFNFSAGTTSNNLTNLVFSNSNNVSFGLNGSTITASIPLTKVNQLIWPENPWQTNFQISNASFSLQHFNAKENITASQANLLMALSGNSNSSGALTVSLGIYTMSGSTMSLASSDSRQLTWTSGSQTSASSLFGGVSGTRYRTVGLANWGISAGDYVIGMWFQTTNNGTWNAYGQQGPTIVGAVDPNETNVYLHGFSTSSFNTAMPASVNLTNTNYVRTGGNALQQPGIIFLGTF